MALILFHSPRGGTGNSFLAATTAIALSRAGHDVTALDFAQSGTLQLHFGIGPGEALPALDAPAEEAASASVQGVALRSAAALARQDDFAQGLAAGEIGFDGEQLFVADISSGDQHLRDLLLPYADLEICPLTATAECLMMLPAVNDAGLAKTRFVMSMVEDTRRFARHSVGFLRELLGDRLLGQVRRDESVIEACAMLQPLGRYAPHSAALADTIALGESVADLLVDILDADGGAPLPDDTAGAAPAGQPGKNRAA
ncbi:MULTISPECIES: cellulose synthase operon protein YhjQ/BcsQ [unclassified Novosphingobium]|uniref:cellulose synthase operon protein YhjQ/BcsQ n=1 Tax=unclassified Novosphingobium TaxID=2644732 RepID=UPI001445C970|nr:MULTISPECIES: cellulose synthase operon protein YhjQ/BcsQ [unclassified Novosphingobium]NKJ42887.1 cellulose biosynthesis protein BcsQ [Novosphingobium sp. SG720]NMN05477.1 cellulose biosynthesis protein BcsQ [Novosphingobium sp. SG919]NMN88164.1 cellulose biosynthesis protein BcsQ [Novosphingobium sp. SG916]